VDLCSPDHELQLTLADWHAELSAAWRTAMYAATLAPEPLVRRLMLDRAALAAGRVRKVARVMDAALALAKPATAARWSPPEGGRFR
jgi:hypothetical protein